jgi:hypothetical protein
MGLRKTFHLVQTVDYCVYSGPIITLHSLHLLNAEKCIQGHWLPETHGQVGCNHNACIIVDTGFRKKKGGGLNSLIISKTYENVVADNAGQKVLPDVPSGYRIISAVTEHYRYGCFVSGSHSIRFYVIVNAGPPVQATNETIGKLTVTFAKNL